jgi:hypothetical protein
MSSPKVISWLPINNTLIAPSQALTAAGNLQLKSSVPGLPQGAFIFDKVIRQVRLTTTGNLSARTFTITGIGSPVDANGNPTQPVALISEDVTGPTSVLPTDSVNIYQQVISISVDGAVANVSAGSGPDGITDFVFLNYNSVFGDANCSLQFLNNVTLSAEGYISLNKPQVPNQNAGNIVTSPFFPFEFISSTSTSVIETVPLPVAVVWLSVKDTSTDSLNFTVLQQGVYP